MWYKKVWKGMDGGVGRKGLKGALKTSLDLKLGTKEHTINSKLQKNYSIPLPITIRKIANHNINKNLNICTIIVKFLHNYS